MIDAGKPPETTEETLESAQFRGEEHRDLLRHTAKAITLVGQEHITYEELDRRLSDDDIELDPMVEVDGDNLLSKLMISFFFKGGHKDLGCEFSHKSFREFLFAEHVVETLKEFGRSKGEFKQREEEDYWKDFEETDPRYHLSRHLAFALGPKWLTHEVGEHITNLIEWEVLRSFEENPYPIVGVNDHPMGGTQPLTTAEWVRVRDGLADLWDWWGEGVPMRPQPYHDKSGNRGIVFSKTLVTEVAERDVWLSRLERRDPLPRPTRVYTVDAHLGDGLLQLCCDVHRSIAVPNWPPSQAFDWFNATPRGKGPRRYQTAIGKLILFAPSNGHPRYFRWYLDRIESAGFRTRGRVLKGKLLAATDLRDLYFDQVDWVHAPDLCFSSLRGASLYGAYLVQVLLREADLAFANLKCARLTIADLRGAKLYGTDLEGANLEGANLEGADLGGAKLGSAQLQRANLQRANLQRANLQGAELQGADLEAADLEGAIDANLDDVILVDQHDSNEPC